MTKQAARSILGGARPRDFRQPHTAGCGDGPWLDRFVSAGDVPLIALCSGIGMVNAAAGTEHLIGRYAPRAIFNYGCAGRHRRDILPGDVIIGDGTVHHGVVHILASGEEFFPGKDYEVTGEVVASTELATDAGYAIWPSPRRRAGHPNRGRKVSTCPKRSSSARHARMSGGSPRPTSGRSSTSASTACTPVTAPSAKTWRLPPSPRSADGTACPS